MNIIQRIRFPINLETGALYIDVDEEPFVLSWIENQKIDLKKDARLSLNTYCNSFYELFYSKYTTLSYLYYILYLEGDYNIKIYRETRDNRKELLGDHVFEKCNRYDGAKVDIPKLCDMANSGRIYLEMKCLSKTGAFYGGFIATDENKTSDIVLAIIICTFKRENYLRNTIKAILSDKVVGEKSFKIIVIDNGNTLKREDFNFDKTELFSNRNIGSAGGFTKGLVQALHEDAYTHFILMDDDIELDAESINRLFTLYEYAKTDFAVTGMPLDLHNKKNLSVANLLYYKGSRPFSIYPAAPALSLSDRENLNFFLTADKIDFGGFWFFSFSRNTILKSGLPLPVFRCEDDVEFGLRIKRKANVEILLFPLVAIWHMPFGGIKYSIDITYYFIRNYLIVDSVYRNFSYPIIIAHLTAKIFQHILGFRYNNAYLCIKGFEDYMKGPALLRETDSEKLHTEIIRLSKKYPDLTALNDNMRKRYNSAFIRVPIRILKSLFTIDGALGIRLIVKWFWLISVNSIRWHSIVMNWQNAIGELSSVAFWEKYLGLYEHKR